MNSLRRVPSGWWLTVSLLMSSVAFCYAFYTEYQKNKSNDPDANQDIISTVEIEGSKSNLYIVEDTATGMVWIGIPGINKTKNK